MRRRRNAFALVVAILGVSLTGCYYDNVEELYPNGCNTNNVTYSGNIVPILEANCLSCHNSLAEQGGVNLEGYENVLIYVEDGSLMGSVRHDPEYVPMPLTGEKLSNCSINRMQAWIDAGALDN